jgi:cell division protein FtsB
VDGFLKIPIGKFLGPLFCAALVFYFGFHALNGDRGIYALIKEQRRLELMNAELERVSSERMELDHRVRMLSSSSLDLDLLDEQAREVLGFVAPDEDVILLDR